MRNMFRVDSNARGKIQDRKMTSKIKKNKVIKENQESLKR